VEYSRSIDGMLLKKMKVFLGIPVSSHERIVRVFFHLSLPGNLMYFKCKFVAM
jgi:hypothetical protein